MNSVEVYGPYRVDNVARLNAVRNVSGSIFETDDVQTFILPTAKHEPMLAVLPQSFKDVEEAYAVSEFESVAAMFE